MFLNSLFSRWRWMCRSWIIIDFNKTSCSTNSPYNYTWFTFQIKTLTITEKINIVILFGYIKPSNKEKKTLKLNWENQKTMLKLTSHLYLQHYMHIITFNRFQSIYTLFIIVITTRKNIIYSTIKFCVTSDLEYKVV